MGGPCVTITPLDSVVNRVLYPAADTVLQVEVTYCSNIAIDWSSRRIYLNNIDVTSTFTHSYTYGMCIYGGRSNRSLALSRANEGLSQLSVMVENVNGYLGGASVWYRYIWPGYTAPSIVLGVSPERFTRFPQPGAADSSIFTVVNLGNRPLTANLTPVCRQGVTCANPTGAPSSVSLDTLSGSRKQTVVVRYTAGAAGDTGSVTLRAVHTSYTTVRDSALTDIMVVTPTPQRPAGVVVVAAPRVLARHLCVTASAGGGAASECGELRLVHGLPSVRTYGVDRAPTLIYGSQHASPQPLIPLEITLPTGITLPDSVVATVKRGSSTVGRGMWRGQDWGAAGATRRVSTPVTTPPSASTVDSVRVEVRRHSGGSSTLIATVSVLVPVVNRSAGSYGRGWWVAGVEQLVSGPSGSWIWIGGDGSVRRYHPSGANVWLADAVDRPDTLLLVGSIYERRMPNNLRIRFNLQGEHIETVNRLGRVTRFTYKVVNGKQALDSIIVPTPLGRVRAYRFLRDGNGYVTGVQSPGPTGTRLTSINIDGTGRITKITDPDGSAVNFSYDGSATGTERYLVRTRTDRRAKVDSFAFVRARLVRSRRVTTQVIANGYRPVELVGLPTGSVGAAQHVDSAYSRLDGPRTDVEDVTRIWVSAHGAPVIVRNPHGRDTRIVYGNAGFPALATTVYSIGGVRTEARYNGRGLIDTLRVINALGTGETAITRYRWNPTWAQPDSVIAPTGVVTTYGYDAQGNVAWTQVGPSISRRITASYYTTGHAAGLYRASTVPGTTARDSVDYDVVLVNPKGVRNRLGHWSYAVADTMVGRVWRTRSLLDTSGREQETTLTYDLADRVILSTTAGSGTTFSTVHFQDAVPIAAESLFVQTQYDPEGLVLQVSRWGSTAITGVQEVLTFYAYDNAGRRVTETEGSRTQLFEYDAAGNLTGHNQGLGLVTMEYDAMGRLTRRITPSVSSPQRSCLQLFYPQYSGCNYNFTFPLGQTGAMLVPGDTATFAYDVAGNMTRADNAAARVRRTFTPGGLVLTDTLRLRTVRYLTDASGPDGFQTNAHVLRFQYDTAGRRTRLTYPSQLCVSNCWTSYLYDNATTGALQRLTTVDAQQINFWYGPAGTVDSIGYPGGVKERVRYDAEGQVRWRTVRLSGNHKVVDDTVAYDPQGRVRWGQTYAASTQRYRSVWNGYGGVGALAVMDQAFSDGADPKRELFVNDQLGNRYRSEQVNFTTNSLNNPSRRRSSYDGIGRLLETWSIKADGTPDQLGYDESTGYQYDVSGNLRFKGYRLGYDGQPDGTTLVYEASYYRADGRLAVFQRRQGAVTQHSQDFTTKPLGVNEQYRYDALGRRVLVWTRRGLNCWVQGCESTVQRYVWDGNQLVYETRGPGADSLFASAIENQAPSGMSDRGQPNAYGRVAYAHAGGIDRPLHVYRLSSNNASIFPHTNWRGLYDGATNTAGQLVPCKAGVATPCSNNPDVDWPGSTTGAFLGATPPARTTPAEWLGSLVMEHADASGLLYRRNRYYDPASGRFTQPDPIGLAGGLNLYGFADGDPVNFSDPFGLSPCDPPEKPCKESEMSETGPVVSFAISGSAAIGPIGGNFEIGLAMNLRNGRSIGYARTGNSLGAGGSLGAEAVVQGGSLNDFVGTDDLNANAKELEIGGPFGVNVPLSASKWAPIGIGGNAGAGMGGFLNLTSGTSVSPVTGNVYQAVASGFMEYSRRVLALQATCEKFCGSVR